MTRVCTYVERVTSTVGLNKEALRWQIAHSSRPVSNGKNTISTYYAVVQADIINGQIQKVPACIASSGHLEWKRGCRKRQRTYSKLI